MNSTINKSVSGSTEKISDALYNQLKTRPQKTAIIQGEQKISYAELTARSHAIGEELRNLGIEKGDKVAVLFPNHSEFVAIFFAIVGIGAVVVPVNPLLKSDEIAHIVSDSQAKILVVHESGLAEAKAALEDESRFESFKKLEHLLVWPQLPEKWAAGKLPPTVSISTLTGATKPVGEFSFDTIINPEQDLALIVYTSGTTGKPKGAMLSHRAIICAVKESLFESFGVDSDDVFLGALPLCHIYGAGVLVYFNVVCGSSLVILPKFDPKTVLATIEKERVTVMPLVPTMYQFLLMELNERSYDTSSLKHCFCAAAPLSSDLHSAVEKKLNVSVYEGYGMSETACGGTVNPKQASRRSSIGKPLKCLELIIRSEDGRSLPPGPQNVGEIAMRGPNIMLGYHGNEEATKAAFADGWFLTGDLAYQDEEGYLYIAGRKKELIIRGGSNIYPREVEDVIARIPGVKDVAVIGVPDKLMGERVKAVVVLKEGTTLTEETIKEFCAEHLAQYKVPRLVEFRQELPRNSTGKILKRALL